MQNIKIPRFLLGAALIFWGLQTGLWILAIPFALIVECSYFIPYQWDLSVADVKRVYRLCWLLFIILFIYLLITNWTIYFVDTILEWIPNVLFPLLVAQLYSKNKTPEKSSYPLPFDLTFPFFTLCLLSASAVYSKDIYFYIGMFILSSLALWTVRSQRYSPSIWLSLILIAGCMGFMGHLFLHQLDLALEDRVVSWLSRNNQQETDSAKQRTNIGDIGLLKLSNDILFRVSSPNPQVFPLLLREAVYDKYQFSSWITAQSSFTTVNPDNNGTTWRLGKKPIHNSTITVSTPLRNGSGLLKLADGTFEIDQLPVSQMEQNRYGTIKVTGKFEAIAYQFLFNPNFPLDSLPTERDLRIPNTERPVLNRIIQQLHLSGKSPQEIVNRVERFFQKNFTYSLTLAGKESNSTPISHFLLQTHAGHCEYFATATTLLLRAAGIPARYTIGYSVHEFSPLENQYIVRSRHAHAWSMVYVNHKWQTLDTTPANWESLEDSTVNQWGLIFDFFSFCGWKFSQGLQYLKTNNSLKYGWWIVLPLLIFILIFILMRKSSPKKWLGRFHPRQSSSPVIVQSAQIDPNSEFYLIEQALNQQGLVRHSSESWKNWLGRLRSELPDLDLLDDLTLLVELYYRDRFDPQGIEITQKEQLKYSIKIWLEQYTQKNGTNLRLKDDESGFSRRYP